MTTPRADKADLFASYWRMLAPDYAPEPVREFRFCHGRKFAFDFAWPALLVAVEVDGGNHMARIVNGRPVAVGRHVQDSDYEKLNIAAALGWRVLRFTPKMLERHPQDCVSMVMRALEYGR